MSAPTSIQVLNYQGKSAVSRIIKFVTNSEDSHSAFRFNIHFVGTDSKGRKVHIQPGDVVEAWTNSLFDRGEVRHVRSLNAQHTPGTPVHVMDATGLTSSQERIIIGYVVNQIGKRYDWPHVLILAPLIRLLFWFKVRRLQLEENDLSSIKQFFCSRLVAAAFSYIGLPLFNHTESWRVPPDWIRRTLRLKWRERVVTS